MVGRAGDAGLDLWKDTFLSLAVFSLSKTGPKKGTGVRGTSASAAAGVEPCGKRREDRQRA